ncbi:penicillin-binding protein [Actibacterium mucosum KCTC 23349]|uniref:Penicillin-binding protein n=1 Tax=Actibacterium mucosum KCTC 23349 TaxID=1454373 RepID=A0A037ZLH2_9RHOB|nr:penicillin-binding protein 2 [Actibacterium mucosum]KAJ56377.1 penicillin-binding protein [Actibacterium mucosum KCTC 23349]
MKQSPKNIAQSVRTIGRRGFLIGATQVAFAGVLAARMRYMQVDQADKFRLLAEENRIRVRLIAPTRGLIFDRNGVPLAINEQNYRIVVVREDAGDVDELLARLSRIVPMTMEDAERARRELFKQPAHKPVTILDRLSWEDFSKVSVNSPSLPGVTPDIGLSRFYPAGEDLAHVVGYVGPVSDYDLSRINDPDPVLQIPRFQIGKTGVEAKTEDSLRGLAGNKFEEQNAYGRIIRELRRTPGTKGADLQLTIDEGLQNFVQKRLGEESASAVVIDLAEGDLLGIASAPSFDPNKFVRGISVADYRALTEHDHRPLASKPFQGIYPPGSTFKMVTALAALEEGVITPDETVYCPGHLESGGRRFHCWKRGGHGHVDLKTSIEQSCDVYYYDVAQRVGIDKISEMARRLGIGVSHDLPLSAVARGLAPNKAWKLEARGADWLIGDTLNASIGQGFVLASPLQLAVMTARIATGRAVSPRLVRTIDGVEAPSGGGERLGLDPRHLAYIRDGMNAVSNNRRGTAFRSRIVAEGLEMAGKTGTSQVRNITAAERAAGVFRNEDLPWERRDHALFVCYAPVENPRVAVSVVVEHGGGGSTAAAPIARDIMLRALYGDVPPLEAYPPEQRRAADERLNALPLRDSRPTSGPTRTRA